ncbi:MAG: DUF5723 family protein [Chitinophagales bacterium]|jgi:hypothetical protein|nr:DUF5723 family protein [Sphingobacteriales bacterium]
MRKLFLIVAIFGSTGIVNGQNSFNAIKTSNRGGILTTLVNPADLAGMPQKFDLNLIGFDMNISNNVINFTSNELGKSDDIKNRFLNTSTPVGFNMRVDADVIGPSLAIAINKKTTIGIITRGRVYINMNNIDVALAKSLIDGTVSNNLTLPYISPNINNMSLNMLGWAEIGLTGSREIFKDKNNSLKIGGTVKALFSGLYANVYMNNLSFSLDKNSSNRVMINNASGQMGVEYNGSGDPTNNISSNLVGGPTGVAFDAGISYQILDKKPGQYKLKIGASLLDIGSMKFSLNSTNSRQFILNPGPHDPAKIQLSSMDEFIASVKTNNVANEIAADSNILVKLPMAFNFQADIKVWQPIFLTINLNRRATSSDDPRSLQALNYLTITPRIVSKFIEVYVPFTFAEIQGTTAGAGFKLGPLYAGSSSIISALTSNNNKAIDVHFGIRAGFGKRFK